VTIAAVVTAAGSGARLGAGVPKALMIVQGRALVSWAVSRIADACDEIVVTAPAAHIADFEAALAPVADATGKRIDVIAGGAERQQSVAAALGTLFAPGRDAPEIVLVHDAARAFQDPAVGLAAIEAVRAGADGAIPVVSVVDTLVHAPSADGTLGDSADRESLRAVQTPQVFKGSVLHAAHLAHADAAATDDAQLVRASGGRVVAVDGHEWGFKVTRPSDIPLAEYIASELGAGSSRTTSTGALPPRAEETA
jgi:2-C-methyl-D-erythritol 4-phosphate cytidylyltransferase